ncbi:NYN domain-containing protein [Stenotrophomonas sp. HITSZ_GD]|uniref:NYN domain-containing protein n=1 Tax=Stenotrophomonas sp. HITSZ_GD TaxID=3037248 RepID=UPI00240D3E4C|nr:NYN domain-containing protein [Stenotrophomonas sp. HITSZ_GD]MDG2525210.1 NYN domain-containing protein [Stenotrophomonas sp. HITSZ_GD]
MVRKTAVYIDGYNLYYGRLRGTGFKWLDVVSLFEHLLRVQDADAEVRRVHYFTSPALGRLATHGAASVLAQQDYHRALTALYPERLVMTFGNHSIDRGGTWMPEYVAGSPCDRQRRVRVWKIEEKQTDVNLALAMCRDAASGEFGQLVICSSDSDLTPAFAAIREDFPQIRLGVVAPRPPALARERGRVVSAALAARADWTIRHLLDEDLAGHQLPLRVPARKRAISRPPHW